MPRFALLTALTSLLPLSACQSDAARYPAVTTGLAVGAIETVLPLPLPALRMRLLARLASTDPLTFPAHPEMGPQFTSYELATNDTHRIEHLFQRYDRFNSSDRTPISTAFHAPVTVTTRLLAYLALPLAARAQDVYINPAQRWSTQEYVNAQGQPLPYSCGYLLHFRPATERATWLEVIAIDSSLLDGTRFGLKTDRDGLGWPLPGQVPHYRDVAPSLTDQRQVLAQFVQLAQ